MGDPKFQIFVGANGEFYFRLRARYGGSILVSEAYKAKQGCLNGVASVRENAPNNDRYKRLTSSNDQFYFTLQATNHKVIGTSEMYSTEEERDKDIEVVKRDAPEARVDDLMV